LESKAVIWVQITLLLALSEIKVSLGDAVGGDGLVWSVHSTITSAWVVLSCQDLLDVALLAFSGITNQWLSFPPKDASLDLNVKLSSCACSIIFTESEARVSIKNDASDLVLC
jgi:hypothetical protein